MQLSELATRLGHSECFEFQERDQDYLSLLRQNAEYQGTLTADLYLMNTWK